LAEITTVLAEKPKPDFPGYGKTFGDWGFVVEYSRICKNVTKSKKNRCWMGRGAWRKT